MKALIKTALVAGTLLLAGCVYEPGYVRSDGYYGDAYYGTDYYGTSYYPSYYYPYYYGPSVGFGIYYSDRHYHHRGHDRGHWNHHRIWNHRGRHRGH